MYGATTKLIIEHRKSNICVNLKTELQVQVTMFAASLCRCDAEDCQSNIYDCCESCKQSFCERCIEDHPCIESDQDFVPDVAAMPVVQPEVQPELQPAVKKRKLGGVIVKSSIRTCYGVDDITNKKNADTVALVPCKSASGVWSHFMRYNSFCFVSIIYLSNYPHNSFIHQLHSHYNSTTNIVAVRDFCC